jgi:ribosomal protein S18 acetylase RimI-like enzyme
MIRNASANDAPQLARLIMLAMGSLAGKFVINPLDTFPLFEHFARLKQNQYSYENILVWDDGGIQGMISGYDGAHLKMLREPFLEYIRSAYGLVIQPEDETQPGEYYIDCLAVFPENQGKGIGKKLIAGLADYAVALGHTKMGLLVNHSNKVAAKFYGDLGFYVAEERFFMGDVYHHLQISLI